MFIYSIGMYLLCLALLTLGSFLDIYTSTKFEKYGLREGNPLFRDARGFMDLKKALIAAAVFVTAQAALFFIFGGDVGLFANFTSAGFGFYRIVQGWRNYDLIQKKKRQGFGQ